MTAHPIDPSSTHDNEPTSVVPFSGTFGHPDECRTPVCGLVGHLGSCELLVPTTTDVSILDAGGGLQQRGRRQPDGPCGQP